MLILLDSDIATILENWRAINHLPCNSLNEIVCEMKRSLLIFYAPKARGDYLRAEVSN